MSRTVWLEKAQLTFGAGDTVVTERIVLNGLLRKLILDVPDWTNTVTATLVIDDGGPIAVPLVAVDQDDIYYYSLDEPIANSAGLTVTLSGVPGGAGGVINITLKGIE